MAHLRFHAGEVALPEGREFERGDRVEVTVQVELLGGPFRTLSSGDYYTTEPVSVRISNPNPA